jgi:hypothetical protein
MFEVVHEFAVLGTTCFMMALATVWYSPMLFGNIWMKEARLTVDMIQKETPNMWKHMVLTFVSYAMMLVLLAQMIAYAPLLSLEAIEAAGFLVLFVVLGSVPTVLSEGKSLRYFGIQAGFYAVFILLGTLILQYWPW